MDHLPHRQSKQKRGSKSKDPTQDKHFYGQSWVESRVGLSALDPTQKPNLDPFWPSGLDLLDETNPSHLHTEGKTKNIDLDHVC